MTRVSKTRMPAARGRAGRPWAAAALVLALALSGCASTLASLPDELGGLPEGTPERPAVQKDYPGIFSTPPRRDNSVLTEEERRKVEAELAAARDRQNKEAADAKPK